MTKCEKQRHVYLTNKKVRTAFDAHIKTITHLQKTKPLFMTQRKSKFTPNVLQKWFREMYRKAGIVGASIHSGRRTFITCLIENGVDIKAVSRLVGAPILAPPPPMLKTTLNG